MPRVPSEARTDTQADEQLLRETSKEGFLIMFQRAAQEHFCWHCSVGGGSEDGSGKVYGCGCLLHPRYVLTAAHIWNGVRETHHWPIVTRPTGAFRCEVVQEWKEWDIMVLRLLQKLPRFPEEETVLQRYASLSDSRVFLGSHVGVISRLTLFDEFLSRDSKAHFSAGYVSMLWPAKDGQLEMHALSNIVVQRGFSGSPVFLPDGSIVGVLVQTISFPIDFEEPDGSRYVLPIMSPVLDIRDDVRQILADS